jgi:hypothetical protein
MYAHEYNSAMAEYFTRCVERFPLAPVVKSHGAMVYGLMAVGLYRSASAPVAELYKRDPDKYPGEPQVTHVRGKRIA